MLSTSFRLTTILACLAFLAGCEDGSDTAISSKPVAASAEISKLKSLGFRTTARTKDGTQVLSYSGPVTRAVVCRSGSGPYSPIPSRRTTSGGDRIEAKLDAYLQLSPGSDGVLSSKERTGVYAITFLNRARGSRKVQGLERITFGPTGRARSKSGLTCRAA